MLWACLLLPHLALDGVLRRHPTPQLPIALVTGPTQKRVLLDVNEAALNAGLHPGQSLNAAHAILEHFIAIDHDPRLDDRMRRFLAAFAYRYSSMVCIEGEDAILLEVQASLSLFGPWPRFEARLREDLSALGFQHRIAVAPTPLGACVLAVAEDGIAITQDDHLRHALGRMPVALSRLPEKLIASLNKTGLRQIKQLLSLPRDGLARRFTPELLQHLDRMTGALSDPRDLYRPPDSFEERIELNYDIEHHPALLFPIKRLVNDLAAYLAGRDGGVQRFVIALGHENFPDTPITVGLLSAERDGARLFDLAKSRLEHTSIPEGVRALKIIARELPPFVPAGRNLFDDRPALSLPWEALRDRFRARLGSDAVYQLTVHPDPRPEHAMRVATQIKKEPEALLLPPRPTWLLHHPIPLRDYELQVLSGPERIESGWWDGGDVRRDYYVVQTSQGQRAWAFQPAGVDEGNWMLQGWFA
ncbi:MAG: Y-family DNA polymerase [Arenimonas sp.]